MIERRAETVAAAGAVRLADATTLRAFPPLRAAWAKQGEHATVILSGRKARRVVSGARHVPTGEVGEVVRERSRGEDVAARCAALGAQRPATPASITSPPPGFRAC